jgi:hypothetical protein
VQATIMPVIHLFDVWTINIGWLVKVHRKATLPTNVGDLNLKLFFLKNKNG